MSISEREALMIVRSAIDSLNNARQKRLREILVVSAIVGGGFLFASGPVVKAWGVGSWIGVNVFLVCAVAWGVSMMPWKEAESPFSRASEDLNSEKDVVLHIVSRALVPYFGSKECLSVLRHSTMLISRGAANEWPPLNKRARKLVCEEMLRRLDLLLEKPDAS
ncbi:hypothetical protein [Haloferula sp. A504]|uniref:hypothetical protein n=1 Tax=Haloferula sp. A504 TaxID=3373601 RepID=UPI0031BC3A2D|nr:hypothetical protein [Verrucomicrobiaceae bacterium E54]